MIGGTPENTTTEGLQSGLTGGYGTPDISSLTSGIGNLNATVNNSAEDLLSGLLRAPGTPESSTTNSSTKITLSVPTTGGIKSNDLLGALINSTVALLNTTGITLSGLVNTTGNAASNLLNNTFSGAVGSLANTTSDTPLGGLLGK